jgi:cell division cycle protein 20 (cofactor of APC complex)
MLTISGRIGQSVMQTGEGVPRGTAKWTKRNHVAAVKVRDSCELHADVRLSHGAHGNHPF